MAISRWDPLHDLLALHERMNRLGTDDTPGWTPAVDLYETADRFVLSIELPGLTRDQIKIELQHETLTVRGERKDSQALREKMRTARRQLREAMGGDVPDEAAVRSAAGAVAALQADQALLRARARSQFMKALTPEQQAQLKQMRVRASRRATQAMRSQRQMIDRDRMVYRNRMMRQQYYRWRRGWT